MGYGPARVVSLGVLLATLACRSPSAAGDAPDATTAGLAGEPTAAPVPTQPAEPTAACTVPLPATPPPAPAAATDCPIPTDPAPAWDRGEVTFVDAPAAPTVTVEVATTPESRAWGLMYRRDLPDGEGMLFVFERESSLGFWMRNTCVPLDMVFVDGAGFVAGIIEQAVPLDESTRRVACPSRFVVEVPGGWARAHGVAPGQRVDLGRWP